MYFWQTTKLALTLFFPAMHGLDVLVQHVSATIHSVSTHNLLKQHNTFNIQMPFLIFTNGVLIKFQNFALRRENYKTTEQKISSTHHSQNVLRINAYNSVK